jgi:CheY-like chemotaxis protein
VVVLLVEDDDAVRAVARRMLELQGMTVLQAANPGEALRAAADHPGRLDVLVTDVRLPGMDGPELAARVRAARPDLRVVFMSGGLREEALHAAAPPDATVEFVQKPFTPAQLVAALRRVLAAAGPGEDTRRHIHPDADTTPPGGHTGGGG